MAYKAGIVGCGRIGCEFDDDTRRKQVSTHAGAYSATAGIELAAACDLDKQKLEKCGARWQIPSLYQDFREMLKKENLDILSICTWNATHLAIAQEAVANGVKAIFCEKPIAESLASADAMLNLCEKGNVVLMVDHQRRFDPFFHEVREYLQAGELGDIQQVTCYYTAGVANTGTHLFDVLRFFFGDVLWVQGRHSSNSSPNPKDPNIDGWLYFQDGFSAAVQACDVKNYLIFEINILGTKGRLRVMSSGFDIQFEHVAQSKYFTGYRELFPAKPPVDATGPRQPMLGGVAHILDCLEHGTSPLSSGLDGRRALEIICGLHESAAAGGSRVSLPLESSSIEVLSK